ncbi:MAG: hypothetical protein IPL61_07450 [Myxococcales bacterium]|nr:hypothetical protein [Myxococcales bacterium]
MRAGLVFVVAIVVASVGCSDDVGLPDARLPIDAAAPGQISITWMLAHAGAPQTCGSVGATGVTAELIPVGAAFGEVDGWSCATGSGTTRPLEIGLYDVRVSVTGGGLLDGPEIMRDVEVKSGQVTAIGPIAFDVEPTGTLVFRISTGTNGNCTDVAMQGAGITATTLELRDGSGACVPTTFAIAAGASQPAGTYVSDCAGASYGCIATDQDVTATDVLAGQHAMIITGAVGAAPCWTRNSQFAVRAGGLTTTLTPQLLALDPLIPGCPTP